MPLNSYCKVSVYEIEHIFFKLEHKHSLFSGSTSLGTMFIFISFDYFLIRLTYSLEFLYLAYMTITKIEYLFLFIHHLSSFIRVIELEHAQIQKLLMSGLREDFICQGRSKVYFTMSVWWDLIFLGGLEPPSHLEP